MTQNPPNFNLIAEEIDNFAQNHLIVDFNYPEKSNQQHIFQSICHKLRIPLNYFTVYEDKDNHFVRYFILDNMAQQMIRLINELMKYDFDRDSIFLFALSLDVTHIPHISQEIQSLMIKLTEQTESAENQFPVIRHSYFEGITPVGLQRKRGISEEKRRKERKGYSKKKRSRGKSRKHWR